MSKDTRKCYSAIVFHMRGEGQTFFDVVSTWEKWTQSWRIYLEDSDKAGLLSKWIMITIAKGVLSWIIFSHF